MERQNTACLAAGDFTIRCDTGQMPTGWRSWQSQTRSTGLVRSTTANRISTSFAGPVQSCAPLFCGRMNLPPRSCVNTSRELTMIVSSASSRQQLRPTNRRSLRSASLSNTTAACGEGFPRGGANRFNALAREVLVRATRRRRKYDRESAFHAISGRDRAYNDLPAGISWLGHPRMGPKRSARR
jgi:hypothetical protein